MRWRYAMSLLIASGMALSYGSPSPEGDTPPGAPIRSVGPVERLVLPKPLATPSADNRSKLIGWPSGRTPAAPPGFRVTAFAEDLEIPRQLYVLPNGDVLVAESGRAGRPNPQAPPPANRILLLRDANHDGKPELREVFLSGLNWPYGMALLGNRFYVANKDSILAFPYQSGQTQITAPGEKIFDLPSEGGHPTRNLASDGKKIYVAVGSSGEVTSSKGDASDPRRSAILELNPDGSGMRVYANGLRNPIGLGLEPTTRALWVTVMERDNLGDDLVPDYLTRVREGAFYGWPYSYFGPNEDPRMKGERPDLVAKAIPPDYALGGHATPIALAFYRGASFPQRYRKGAFLSLHGSWNRSRLSGYKVVFLPFQNGKPSGDPEDFLTGFIAEEADKSCDFCSTVYGRPAGIAIASDGSLLVADDSGNVVWRVSYEKASRSARSR